jgi:hypothetical protein
MSHSDFDVVTGPSMAQRRDKRHGSSQPAGEQHHSKTGAIQSAKTDPSASSGTGEGWRAAN